MANKRIVYDTRDLENATEEMLRGVNRALLAAAFKIRDDMRDEFRRSIGEYKYATEDYYRMAQGIMVGKLQDGSVKIHALGNYENDGTWKARFFVGGTTYRKNVNGDKGYIKANNAIDKGMNNAQNTLNNYINNALNN
jgi:hypothetical protein